jgi:hypothetical protein
MIIWVHQNSSSNSSISYTTDQNIERCEEGTATECLPMIMTYTSIQSLKEVIAESSANPGKMVGENKKIAMHSILTVSIHAQLMQHI